MRRYLIIGLLSFLGFSSLTSAQDTTNTSKSAVPVEGTVGLRTFWMSTSYFEDFKGDYALGQAAFLRLKTKDFKGFSLAARYTLFANVWSSNLLDRDPITGNFNRYEVGLFDVTNPADRLFGKLEELQLRYQSEKISAVLGRMDINTPFINPQDGRLSPTFVQGVQLAYRPNKRHQFTGYFIDRISPRSTSGWYDVGQTFGLYPVGQSTFGKPSLYKGKTDSHFVSVLDWKGQVLPEMSLQVNHTFVDNVSSTYFLQALNDWKQPGRRYDLFTGAQFILQHGVGEGGNPDRTLQFKHPEDLNYVFGWRIGIKNPRMQWHLNYTRVDGRGRFLSPREWGRDPFFTFIPRERNEGYNQVDAITTYYQRNLPKAGLQLYGFAGLHFLPDPTDVEINKFGFPSYAQANLGGRYTPDWGKGLDFHLILMSKINIREGEMKPQWIYNKVDMFHVNFIVNYQLTWK